MTVMRPHPPNKPANEAFDRVAKARFWRKVSPAPADACWPWRGAIGRHGYGNVSVGGKTYLAHRASYELANGPIPNGLDIDHVCRNKTCVNPGHLDPVTFLVNMRRRYGLDAAGLARAEEVVTVGDQQASGSRGSHYKSWTAAELEVAARTDLTEQEVALMLGRTIRAVRTRRHHQAREAS